jgi:hypothetical protein
LIKQEVLVEIIQSSISKVTLLVGGAGYGSGGTTQVANMLSREWSISALIRWGKRKRLVKK